MAGLDYCSRTETSPGEKNTLSFRHTLSSINRAGGYGGVRYRFFLSKEFQPCYYCSPQNYRTPDLERREAPQAGAVRAAAATRQGQFATASSELGHTVATQMHFPYVVACGTYNEKGYIIMQVRGLW